ncbi:hypothetical protein ACIO6T_30910 [Streptomyces sp. NPDC087532]|uniref:hypothetical protein n=1 Tax=Streptomyces sp. NPDC087532 TaxID=3365795 RepID=UPI00381D2926
MIARRELVQAVSGRGGLPKGEDFIYVCAVTAFSAGALSPVITYHYRQHEEQMVCSRNHDCLGAAARQFAWHSGR